MYLVAEVRSQCSISSFYGFLGSKVKYFILNIMGIITLKHQEITAVFQFLWDFLVCSGC